MDETSSKVSLSKGLVLYFEDDAFMAKQVNDFLQNKGFDVIHYADYPAQGGDDIKNRVSGASESGQPNLVLTDIELPSMNGYDICRTLRKEYLEDKVPVIFASSKMEEQSIMKAYDAGGDDYLTKPIRMEELGIKIDKLMELGSQRHQHESMVAGAQKMAFDAMATSAKLGEIIRFHEEIYLVNTFPELAKLLLEAINGFSVSASVMFFTEKGEYFSDDGQDKPMERKVLSAFKDQDRIFDWKNRTFFNYKNFSILIRKMPASEEENGILRDHLCILLNGVDTKIKALLVERANKRKALTMKIAADTIANMVMEMESTNVELSEKFERIILKMEADINSDIIQFNLLENEEAALQAHVLHAIKESTQIFEESLEKEKQYKEIMTRLLKELISNH